MKKLVKLESLRRPFENQILTPWDMYQWAHGNIENITFFCFNRGHCFTSHTLIIQNRLTMQKKLMAQEVIPLFSTKWSNKA